MSDQKIFNTLSPWLLSLLRIIVAFLFIEHGTSKLFHYPASMGHIPLFSLIGIAGILETFGGGLLFLGLYTRFVAFILSGEMAFAYFMVHAPRNFWPLLNHGEAAVFFCFVFLYFASAGGGKISLDRLIRNKK